MHKREFEQTARILTHTHLGSPVHSLLHIDNHDCAVLARNAHDAIAVDGYVQLGLLDQTRQRHIVGSVLLHDVPLLERAFREVGCTRNVNEAIGVFDPERCWVAVFCRDRNAGAFDHVEDGGIVLGYGGRCGCLRGGKDRRNAVRGAVAHQSVRLERSGGPRRIEVGSWRTRRRLAEGETGH